MALVARPIQQLNLKGPDIWTLDWFGGLVDNPKDYCCKSVECVLTPCTPNPESTTGLKRHKKRQVVTTIGVSALNAICIGRQYLNGKMVPLILENGWTEEVISFRFNPMQYGSVKDMMLDQVGLHDFSALINKELTADGLKSPVKIVDGFLTSTTHRNSPDRYASADHPRALKVMFHELEIIRFYYTNSQRLVKAVFANSFMSDNLYRDVVFAKYDGPHFILDEGKCRFEYQLGFYHVDLPIIGRMLFDTTGTAMRGARRIYQSTHISIQNEISDRKTAYPQTLFPYLGEVELTLKGRRLKLMDGNYVFAVHRIESCNAPFPFKVLSVQRETEPGGLVNAPPGSPEAFPTPPPEVTGPGHDGGELDTEGRPLENSVFADSEPEVRRYLGLRDVCVLHEKPRPNTHTTGEHRSVIFNPELTKSSPGTPTSASSEAVNQKLVDTLEGSDPPVDMDTFIAILSRLQARNRSWIISTIPLSENAWKDPVTKVTYCGFPSIACPERKSVFRQFSFHDRQKKKRRHLVCAQILANNKFVYLLEAERRQNDQGKDMEALPILVLWSNGFLEIENHKFQSVLAETVKNPSKTWPQDVSAIGLMRGAIEHRRESKASKMDETLTEAGRMELGLKEAVERIEKVVAGVLALAR